ncbi:MAG: RluA family pseudouridine synthase [Candidatus Saccharimonadales bacterium]
MQFKVEAMFDHIRLDNFVAKQLPLIGRSQAKKMCAQGEVLINKQIAEPTDRVVAGDTVTIYMEFMKQAIPDIKIPILYEDDNCVVIDKPIGVLSHSKGRYNPEATVASWLQNRYKQLGDGRDGIVHRLDRATSGVMICAKNKEAYAWFQKQFSQRKVKKTYIALINGKLDPPEAIIDMPIERNPKAPATFRVGANGKPSLTHYLTLQVTQKYSLLELKPETGRTHQLRVHLKKLNHPIVGDTLYDGEKASRLFLHAHKLDLQLPDKKTAIFISKIPREFFKQLKSTN